MDKIKIPVALQIVMDDMGWHKGENGLKDGRSARTGINRDHEVEDYIVLNEIGKKIDMHFMCGFTIGELDKDNVLRGMKHATLDEEGWDRASEIDYEKTQKFFEAIENSEYIDLAFHGTMHGYWENGDNFGNPREFYSFDLPEGATERRVDYPVVPVSAEYVDEHLDAWFKIYNSWGFTKKVETIISPASLYKDKWIVDSYAEKAKKYGIKYWKNLWVEHNCLTENFKGIIFLNAQGELVDWNHYDVEPLKDASVKEFNEDGKYPIYSVLGCHWANFVHSDPKDNLKYVDQWAEFFLKQKKIFGRMLSKNMAFACHQAQYHVHTKMNFENNVLTLDVTDVLNQDTISKINELYISIKNDLVPKEIKGGTIEVFEVQDDFKTYKITVENNIIKISF